MKTTVSIYQNEKLIVQKSVNGKNQAEKFINENLPTMTMEDKVKNGWRVFRSYNNNNNKTKM